MVQGGGFRVSGFGFRVTRHRYPGNKEPESEVDAT
jgi:hypothetical protein